MFELDWSDGLTLKLWHVESYESVKLIMRIPLESPIESAIFTVGTIGTTGHWWINWKDNPSRPNDWQGTTGYGVPLVDPPIPIGNHKVAQITVRTMLRYSINFLLGDLKTGQIYDFRIGEDEGNFHTLTY